MGARVVMLARVAQTLYWMARDLERAETLAHLLQVTHATALEGGTRDGSAAMAPWERLVAVVAEPDVFRRTHRRYDQRSVTSFAAFGPDNPSNIVVSVQRAREGARSVRDLLPTEVWEGINTLHLAMARWPPGRIGREGVYPFCERVRRECNLITGLVFQTMRRDEAWEFMRLGRYLERAERSLRLFAVQYGALEGAPAGTTDLQDWNTLLQCASAHEAYIHAEPLDLSPESVGRFLLLDRRFPRAVAFCFAHVEAAINALIAADAMVESPPPLILIRTARDMIATAAAEPWGADLEGLLSRLSERCTSLDDAIAESCFAASYDRTPPIAHEQAARQA